MKKTANFFFTAIIIFSFFGCTTQKNTAVTRTYHNITARYNIYFNGYESFNSGVKSIEEDFEDDFNEILPVFLYSDKDQVTSASGDMETALTKGAKAITNHSITVKPEVKNNSNLTQKDKDFYNKTEYCRWIDDSYLLMGKANLYTLEYQRAMRSFRLIINQYKSEDTRFEAMLWLAKTYIEQEKFSDAYDILNELETDVRHPKKLNQEIIMTFADLYLRQDLYTKALPRIIDGIELTKNKNSKARYTYILAQIYEEIGNNDLAFENYKKIIKMNPSYDFAFNAKIKIATSANLGAGDVKDIKKQLKKLLKDEKNIEYKDQIYFAMANIEMKEDNETQAIEYYKLSAQKSVSNNTQKAISYLSLADIYFLHPNYLLAGAYYDSTMQFLEDDYDNYEEISKKAENLSELVEHLKIVQFEDSVQNLAGMSETERNAIIDEIIQNVVAAEEAEAVQNTGTYVDPMDEIEVDGASWYFYNLTAVSLGVTEFKKKWGTRVLEDDWRRRNKASVTEYEETDETETADSTRISDNKTREFYLQDIPLTDSLIEISNSKIIEALFSAGEIYEKKMNDYPEAVDTYEDLITRYPENVYLLESYYNLYKLCALLNYESKMEYYKNQIINQFPDSKYAKMLLDPSYIDQLIAIESKAVELYTTTLADYKLGNYSTVITTADFAFTKYTDSKTLPKFLYLKALSYGELGDIDNMVTYLSEFIKKYPVDDAVENAQAILDLIESGKYDMDIYNDENTYTHIYVLALKAKDYDLEALKFKFIVLSGEYSNKVEYKIEQEDFNAEYKLITVKTFNDKADAYGFYNQVITKFTLSDLEPEDFEHFVISENNLNILKDDKIIEKYMIFFKENYK